MPLTEYKAKRNFKVTPEPKGSGTQKQAPELSFVVQKHQASHLHYDFRLEWNGVLLSWAIPKGPSLDPSVKRLAMAVEDHPVEYGGFEGSIPAGEYGGGTVMVWDRGTWQSQDADVDGALKAGELKFVLHGTKLRGSWVLVRTKGIGKSSREAWLLIKHKDKYASSEDVTTNFLSAISKRSMAAIAAAFGGDVEKAAKSDTA